MLQEVQLRFNPEQAAHQAFRAVVTERTSSILAWVGAGLSMPAGLPSWFDLKIHLLEAMERKADDLDEKAEKRLRGAAAVARGHSNPWVAFEIIKEHLGKTTYRETVRGAFAQANTAPIPDAYTRLWRLGVSGLLTLNLDRLATRALTDVHPGTAAAEFSGRDVARLLQFLASPHPFIGNLHGVFEDTQSWVFTKEELTALFDVGSYGSFIEACLSSHTVLFLGLSAQDQAVGGHLERLAKADIETTPHYWLTDRRDNDTDEWAEAAGIRVIRYDASDGDHSGVSEFFRDLEQHVPREPEPSPPPVTFRTKPDAVAALPGPREILAFEPEEIRRLLNAHAVSLLSADTEDAYEAYDAFCDEYDRAIYLAWYTSDRTGDNELLEYTLNGEIAQGAFGRVYAATDANGQQVAVKVLLEEIRRQPELIRSFRRGVRSMRILQQRDVEGMVAYRDGSEIPAFVVMDWVDGPNLSEAKRNHFLPDWDIVLRVAHELAVIIQRAHRLPERVMHRDLRPANVMMKNYYADYDNWEVVVLDFDLSWHRGAYEQTVVRSGASLGYLAPEQLSHLPGVSTRNAGVDSFGLGMTFLFLCGGEDPVANQHLHERWKEDVAAASASLPAPRWRSTPQRFARLIRSATMHNQVERWDLSQIVGELERLRAANSDPRTFDVADLVAEELAARTAVFDGYEWSVDSSAATKVLPTGMMLSLSADLVSSEIQIEIRWSSTGVESWKDLAKYVPQRAQTAADRLKAKKWRVRKLAIESQSVELVAALDAGEVISEIDSVAASIDAATEQLFFSRLLG